MKATVVIPTYNGAGRILHALHSLENQTTKDFEVIVAVDGSTDNTLEILSSYASSGLQVKIVLQENKGRASIRNYGASYATTDLIIFMDDDMRFEPNVVEKHLHFHSLYDAILVGGQIEQLEVMQTDFQFFKAYLSRKWAKKFGNEIYLLNDPFITAAHFSVKKNVFDKLNGFNEILTDAEDFDLAVRAFSKNIKIYVDASIVGWHDQFFTCAQYIKRQKQYKKAHQKLRDTYPDLYKDYNKVNDSILGKIKYNIFANEKWVKAIDDEKSWIHRLPKRLRFKIYDYVITENSKKDNWN